MVYAVKKNDNLDSIFSSYQKAVTYIMMHIDDAKRLVRAFERSFDVDYYYFSDGNWYSIEEYELDGSGKYE